MSFTVASYNVLADAYVRAEYYPSTAPEWLDPRRRHPALADRVAGLDADVVCLQEVEPAALAVLRSRLDPLGYDCHFAARAGGHPDGCALAVRASAFAVRDVRTLVYADGGADGGPSGHIAQIALLQRPGSVLGVAVTHIRWAPPETPAERHIGVRQVEHLLAEISGVQPRPQSWIVCGDFNATADSPVVAPLLRAGFVDAFGHRPAAYTCNAQRRARRIDFLFHTADLAARVDDPPAIDGGTPLPSDREPSDHLPIRARLEPAALRPPGGR